MNTKQRIYKFVPPHGFVFYGFIEPESEKPQPQPQPQSHINDHDHDYNTGLPQWLCRDAIDEWKKAKVIPDVPLHQGKMEDLTAKGKMALKVTNAILGILYIDINSTLVIFHHDKFELPESTKSNDPSNLTESGKLLLFKVANQGGFAVSSHQTNPIISWGK